MLLPLLMYFIELSEEMYRDGYLNITNMDISEVVLEKMHQVYTKPGPKSAQFECGFFTAKSNRSDNGCDEDEL